MIHFTEFLKIYARITSTSNIEKLEYLYNNDKSIYAQIVNVFNTNPNFKYWATHLKQTFEEISKNRKKHIEVYRNLLEVNLAIENAYNQYIISKQNNSAFSN